MGEHLCYNYYVFTVLQKHHHLYRHTETKHHYLGSIYGRWRQTLLHWRVSPKPNPPPLYSTPTWQALMPGTLQSNSHDGTGQLRWGQIAGSFRCLQSSSLGRSSLWHWPQGTGVARYSLTLLAGSKLAGRNDINVASTACKVMTQKPTLR